MRPSPSPSPEPEPPPTGDGPEPWVIDLDAPDDPRGQNPRGQNPGGPSPRSGATGGPTPSTPSPRARLVAAGLVIVLAGAITAIWRSDPPAPRPVPTVLGTRLAAPIALTRPVGAVTTADSSYVGLQFPAGGVVLVTVPTGVVDPVGRRQPLPDDPAGWLARHPAVFVSRARTVRLGDVTATQLDYRRSRMNAPPSRFARLPLFCGWRPETGIASACTQITADARVRATFVPVGGQTVLVEAVWRAAEDGTGRMPRDLQRSYTDLLTGLHLGPGVGARRSVA